MGMPKYDRLLHILNMLRTRRNLNAATLAEECGVTERSIYRDIISLSEANVPIYYDNGYKLASDNFLPPLNFDFEEYACLKLALDSSPLARTGYWADIVKRIRGKVDASLSDAVRQQKRTSVETTHIDIDVAPPPKTAQQYFRLLEKAIADDLCLEMTYLSINTGETTRIVEPYFLIFRARAFYFVAYCRLREGFRTFRVDRIRDLRPIDEHFRRRAGVNAREYFEGSWEVYSGEPAEVELIAEGRAARVIITGHHHQDEEITPLDKDRVRYRVTVNGTEEIKRWLLGLGHEVQVIRPESLRRELAEFGEFLSRTYFSK